jgi:DNA-binding beta-propeller fold protein YncE
MRSATLFIIVFVLAGCHNRNAAVATRDTDSVSFIDASPRDTTDSALLTPRVITGPTVIVFWLQAADSFSADDQAQALDELNNTTESVAPTLDRNNIKLLPTNAETIYVALPNHRRRSIVLSGIDYPFGYVLVEPGLAERILAGVYDEDELLDEVEAYFDLPESDDSTTTTRPRIST